MHYQVNYKNQKGNNAPILILENPAEQEFRIKYEIKFLQGDYKGKTETIFVDLWSLEYYALGQTLKDGEYFGADFDADAHNPPDFYEIVSAIIFVANFHEGWLEID